MFITHSISKSSAITALREMRIEWQETTEEDNLLEVEASVGLLIADVLRALQLTPDEAITVLGIDLFEQVAAFEIEPVGLRINGTSQH